MLIPVQQPFDLTSTLESGQAFRWRRDGAVYRGVVFGNVVQVGMASGGIEFSAAPDDERDLAPLLRDYMGLGTDLTAVYRAISVDRRVAASIGRYPGMRLLRQDPWECLVCFICSSASNIPRITRNVEDLCTAFGRPIKSRGVPRRTFPTPQELAEAGQKRIFELGLGYRAGYLASTARAIADGKLDLMALREDGYEDALDALTTLDGVGDKVANCVLLFSLDKPEAFPVDVWVQRALREWYFDGTAKKMSPKRMRLWARDYFGPYAGYASQYLFHDRRLMGRARQDKGSVNEEPGEVLG